MVGTGENLCPEFHEEAVTNQKGVYRLRGLSVSIGVMLVNLMPTIVASVCVQCEREC